MVSIIIPYINEHDYLLEAISSATNQRGIEEEIIVVCNSPEVTPGSQSMPELPKDVVFLHETKIGSAYARNAGLRQAKGEWIQFLDVDDLLLPEKIIHQLDAAQSAAIVAPHHFLYLNGKREKSKWLPEDVWCGLLNSGLGSTSSMLWRRDDLLEIGGWNPLYSCHQEYELLFRMAAAGKSIDPNAHCETIVRQRGSGSITLTTQSVRVREGIRLREAMWTHLTAQGEDTPERFEAFRQYIFRQLRGLYRQDKQEAILLFEKYFLEVPFTPKDIHVPGYGLLFKLLGFKRTESMIQFLISFRK